MNWRTTGWVGAGMVALLSGCSLIVDSHTRKSDLTAAWQNGNFSQAAALLDEEHADAVGSGDELLWQLESGGYHLAHGDLARAQSSLAAAELLVDAADDRAIISLRGALSEGAAALTNANALPYRGWTRDRIQLPASQALCYLGRRDPEGALVEIRRLRQEQQLAMERYNSEIAAEEEELQADRNRISAKLSSPEQLQKQLQSNVDLQKHWQNVAQVARKEYGNFLNPFAIFLSGLGCLIENDYNNAVIDFERLYRIAPNSPLIGSLYAAVLQRNGDPLPGPLTRIKPYAGSLRSRVAYVIFANGRGPALEQFRLDLLLPYVGYTGFAVPVLKFYDAPFRTVAVQAGATRCNTENLASMDAVMANEYQARLPAMITRLLVNVLVKESASLAAVIAAQEAARNNPDQDWVVVAAYLGTGIYKYMFNVADTRSWEMLPKEYQLAVVPIPADGVLKLTPEPAGRAVTVELDQQTQLAVILLSAPSAAAQNCRVFELNRLPK